MSTAALYLFAFGSGFAALIYQVAWSRMLALTFGSSTLAVSAVVAGFMGGMGIGAWLYHRADNRVDSPLRAYAILEIGIAISTALLTLVYVGLPQHFAAWSATVPVVIGTTFSRVIIVFLLLLLPSALMGATYPALCRALIHSAEEVDRRLGWIYGLNTLGAAAGALSAGFVLIELVGLAGSVRAANAINLAIGIGSLVLSYRALGGTDSAHRIPPAEGLSSDLPRWTIALVLFASGFATLGYEIVWFRALHYLLGPGSYVLSSLLTIFLLGLGFGSFLLRPALRVGRPEWNLGLSQLGVALLAILAMRVLHLILETPELYARLSPVSAGVEDRPWQVNLLVGSCSAMVLMLPATLWMGLSFPLGSRLFLGKISQLTSTVGLAYLLSNLGSITGAIAAAVWVLPKFGSIGGTKLFASINLALGLLVLIQVGDRKIKVVTGSLAALIALSSTLLPERLAIYEAGRAAIANRGARLVFEEESDLGTVQVLRARQGAFVQVMNIDGTTIATTRSASFSLFAKQLVLAHLPMTLDREIRHTLNLGVASGSTIASLAKYPWVESLDAVEINPAVLRGAKVFPDSRAFADPRAHIVVEDALHYLLSNEKTYDLIINDAKGNFRSRGTSKMLSREIYQYSLARLGACGMFVERIVLTHGPQSLEISLRTVRSVFPELEVFVLQPNEVVLVGSRCPIGGRKRPSREELERTAAGKEIRKYFLTDPTALPALWVSSGREIDAIVGNGVINSWDKLPLEYLSFRQPPITEADMAAGLALVLGSRARGEQAPPAAAEAFSSLAIYDDLERLNRALLAWFEGRREDMTTIIGGIRPESRDQPIIWRTLQLLQSKPKSNP